METYFFGRFVFKLCSVTEKEKTHMTYLECFVVESVVRVSTLSFEGLLRFYGTTFKTKWAVT
jgi:hypothetical protein